MDFETYLYFWGSLIGIGIFTIVFLRTPHIRNEMLISGLVVGIVGVFSEKYFFQDYWRPPLIARFGEYGGIEDFLFGFAAGGIGAVIFNVLFSARLVANRKPRYFIIPAVFVSEYLSILIFTKLFGINSIFASAVGLFIPVLIMIALRKDLVKDVFYSAIIAGLILAGGEALVLTITGGDYLERFYLLHGEAPILFGVFPVTEFLWGLSFGALIGPVYEFATGRSMRRSRSK